MAHDMHLDVGRLFMVTGALGARVRHEQSLTSREVGVLPHCHECVAEDAALEGQTPRVKLSSPICGWVSFRVLKKAPVQGIPFKTDLAQHPADTETPRTTRILQLAPPRRSMQSTKTKAGWSESQSRLPSLGPLDWSDLPGNVALRADTLSDAHTTVLLGGHLLQVGTHPARRIAAAGPAGPSFPSHHDRGLDMTCATCRKASLTFIVYAAICSQQSSYSLAHYQWVVEYELYCLACDSIGNLDCYTTRTNVHTALMPAAQPYIRSRSLLPHRK